MNADRVKADVQRVCATSALAKVILGIILGSGKMASRRLNQPEDPPRRRTQSE
jgi:hypothetical protein